MSAILVFFGGGIGSLLRYGISNLFPYSSGFPWATFISNILACLLMGFIINWIDRTFSSTFDVNNLKWLLLTGICGGFSTFSTFSNESLQLIKQQQWALAITYILTSVILGILSLTVGLKNNF
jgi:fluoride exporter